MLNSKEFGLSRHGERTRAYRVTCTNFASGLERGGLGGVLKKGNREERIRLIKKNKKKLSKESEKLRKINLPPNLGGRRYLDMK